MRYYLQSILIRDQIRHPFWPLCWMRYYLQLIFIRNQFLHPLWPSFWTGYYLQLLFPIEGDKLPILIDSAGLVSDSPVLVSDSPALVYDSAVVADSGVWVYDSMFLVFDSRVLVFDSFGFLPVVPHKAVAEVSRIFLYDLRTWIWCWMMLNVTCPCPPAYRCWTWLCVVFSRHTENQWWDLDRKVHTHILIDDFSRLMISRKKWQGMGERRCSNQIGWGVVSQSVWECVRVRIHGCPSIG